MKRKKFILAVILTIMILGTTGILIFTLIKNKETVRVLGLLNFTEAANSSVEGFMEGMTKLGYEKDVNIKILYSGVQSEEDLKIEARQFVSQNVDIIVTMSTAATLIAKKAVEGTDIPIIFGPVSNPVENGIVTDNLHKGENITGVMFGAQEEKRLGMLVELAPYVKKVFVPYNPDSLSPVISLNKLDPIRAELGIEFVYAPAADSESLEYSLASMPADIDAVFIPTDPFMASRSGEIAEAASRRGLISSSPHRDGVKAGALYSYSFDLNELGKEVARLVDQVLKGASPVDLPLEVSEFFLSVNTTTADRIGFKVPDSLLRQATIYK